MSRGRRNARRGVCHLCHQLVTISFRTGLFAEHGTGGTPNSTLCPASGTPSGIAPAKPPRPRGRPSLRESALQSIAELAAAHLVTLEAIRRHHAERRDPEAVPSDTRTAHRPMTPEERDRLLDLERIRMQAESSLRNAIRAFDRDFT